MDELDDGTVIALMLQATGEDWDEEDAWKLRMFAKNMNASCEAMMHLRRIAHELRAYNLAADEHKGKHIHKVWAAEIDSVIEQASKERK